MKTNKIYAKTPSHFQKNDSINESISKKPNFLISFFQKFQRKSKKYQNENNPMSPRFNTNIEYDRNEMHKFFSFVHILMIILKAIRLFNWNTQYRSLKHVTNQEILFINDIAYYGEDNDKNKKFSFIKNKFLRMKLLALKIKLKKMNRFVSKNKKLILIFLYILIRKTIFIPQKIFGLDSSYSP